jgi:hypothetical protein
LSCRPSSAGRPVIAGFLLASTQVELAARITLSAQADKSKVSRHFDGGRRAGSEFVEENKSVR